MVGKQWIPEGKAPWNITLVRTALGWGVFSLFLLFFFKESVPVQKFTHLKLQKSQFIFGSLQSLDPSADRISLEQQEHGGTPFSSGGAARCLLEHDSQELCLQSHRVWAHEYIPFYSKNERWAWRVNRISVCPHIHEYTCTQHLHPHMQEFLSEWGPGEVLTPSRTKTVGKFLMQPWQETSPHPI